MLLRLNNQISWDFFLVDQFHIGSLAFVLYAARLCTILEGVQSFLVEFAIRGNAGDHHCFRVSAK